MSTLSKAARAALLVSLAATGCGHSRTSSPPPAASAPRSDLEARASSIATQVATLRQLPQKGWVDMRFVDDRAFVNAFTAHLAAQARSHGLDAAQEVEAQRALWVSLGFIGPHVAADAALNGVAEQQLRGYYDPTVHRLFVRNRFPAAAVEGTLAHELEHALQDQHFSLPSGKHFDDDDARMAAAAAFEGDAQLAALAYLSNKMKRPFGDVVIEQTKMLHTLPTAALLQLNGLAPALMSAPALYRERLIFPYLAGLDLVTTFYRAGGFALVDRVLEHPPASSEQVLHPDKYLAGERPIPVREPALPSGYRPVTDGRLGELGARTLLGSCVSFRVARERASGWGGDHYRIGEGPDHALAFLWSTVWDDEAHARNFEAALHEQVRCWKEQPPGAPNERFVRNLTTVRRQGTAVVLVRGLAPGDAEPLVAPLLALADARLPDAPPALGAVTLPAEPDAVQAQGSDGTLDGGVFVSRRLDVAVATPAGFTAQVGKAPELLIRASQPPAQGSFVFAPQAIDPEQYFRLTAASVSASLGSGRRLTPVGGGPVDLGWAKGVDRVWAIDGLPLRFRGLLVRACGGQATVAFTELWAVPAAKTALDGWIAAFAPHGPAAPPACNPPH